MKTGFKLSIDKTGKDQGKADLANAFIGYGVTNRKSSTGVYAADATRQEIPVNDQIIANSETCAFVSVAKEGVHNSATVAQIVRVLEAGGCVVMDRDQNAHSNWNRFGEGAVQDELRKIYGAPAQTEKGYNCWKKPQNRKAEKLPLASRL